MASLTRESLLSLEAYARERPQFRARVLSHKKHRYVHLGDNITLSFENELTIRYQIQEMLRAERIFEEDGIEAELDAYRPLVPDGSNLKATMLIEYVDGRERAEMLAKLIGIAEAVWLQVAGFGKVHAIADEDLPRDNESKTSSVHFLRFEFDAPMIRALKAGAVLSAGIDHPQYKARVASVNRETVASLSADLTI